jgi:SAM-dependent methyltransferase
LQAIERFGIHYVAPAYLQTAGLKRSSFDVFCSVDTLEHIPPTDLGAVLAAGRELLKPGGVMVHLIDYGDHYARSDNGLSRFNFLTYTERDWHRFNSKFQYVNRLRHSQFLRMFNDVGMTIYDAEPDVEAAQSFILEHLAPEFAGMEIDDLFTLRAMIVSRA